MGGRAVHQAKPSSHKSSPIESAKVFVDNVDTFLSRTPAVIAQHCVRSTPSSFSV
ncbi:hypothetical protein V1527DRAFT_479568 [Lipomyces starkeyi]